MEKTLVIIKPDAMQRGLAGEIIRRLEARGLKIVAMKLIWMSQSLAHNHYAEHEGLPFFPGLVSYITSRPVIVAVFEGANAVDAVRITIGRTNPLNAEAGTIRGDLGLESGRNLVHAADSPESAQRSIGLFFDEPEIVSYSREVDCWIFE